MQTGNILTLFMLDTFVSHGSGQTLKEFMQAKHGWSDRQFEEYKQHYFEFFANQDTVAALASLNPGQRDNKMLYEVKAKTYELHHGDKWTIVGPKQPYHTDYIYLYNPHLFKYMFRRVVKISPEANEPDRAIWFEVHEIIEWGGVPTDNVLTQA